MTKIVTIRERVEALRDVGHLAPDALTAACVELEKMESVAGRMALLSVHDWPKVPERNHLEARWFVKGGESVEARFFESGLEFSSSDLRFGVSKSQNEREAFDAAIAASVPFEGTSFHQVVISITEQGLASEAVCTAPPRSACRTSSGSCSVCDTWDARRAFNTDVVAARIDIVLKDGQLGRE